MTFCIKYNTHDLCLDTNGDGQIQVEKVNHNEEPCILYNVIENTNKNKYVTTLTYKAVRISYKHSNSNILPVYVVLMFHFKVENPKDLHEKIVWDYTEWKWHTTSKNEEHNLPDHLTLLNYFLNLKFEYGKVLNVSDIESKVRIKDKRGLGGERPRELNYRYGFPYYTSSTKKFLKNSERLFMCPFPICPINPSRMAIVSQNPMKCFTCGCCDGDIDIFGNTVKFEKGHFTPIKQENTTQAHWQCKRCNTFYKDKLSWNVRTGKPTFNAYAVMRDVKKSELIQHIKSLGITCEDLK